jgi:hypothetical protein
MPDLSVSEAGKNGRILSLGSFRFGPMTYVIQANTQNLLRIWDYWRKVNLIYSKAWRALRAGTLQFRQCAGSQH